MRVIGDALRASMQLAATASQSHHAAAKRRERVGRPEPPWREHARSTRRAARLASAAASAVQAETSDAKGGAARARAMAFESDSGQRRIGSSVRDSHLRRRRPSPSCAPDAERAWPPNARAGRHARGEQCRGYRRRSTLKNARAFAGARRRLPRRRRDAPPGAVPRARGAAARHHRGRRARRCANGARTAGDLLRAQRRALPSAGTCRAVAGSNATDCATPPPPSRPRSWSRTTSRPRAARARADAARGLARCCESAERLFVLAPIRARARSLRRSRAARRGASLARARVAALASARAAREHALGTEAAAQLRFDAMRAAAHIRGRAHDAPHHRRALRAPRGGADRSATAVRVRSRAHNSVPLAAIPSAVARTRPAHATPASARATTRRTRRR